MKLPLSFIKLFIVILHSELSCVKISYFDQVVPLCGLLMMLNLKDFGLSMRYSELAAVIKRVVFVGVLGLILYYRLFCQLSWVKLSFFTVIGKFTRRARKEPGVLFNVIWYKYDVVKHNPRSTFRAKVLVMSSWFL